MFRKYAVEIYTGLAIWCGLSLVSACGGALATRRPLGPLWMLAIVGMGLFFTCALVASDVRAGRHR